MYNDVMQTEYDMIDAAMGLLALNKGRRNFEPHEVMVMEYVYKQIDAGVVPTGQQPAQLVRDIAAFISMTRPCTESDIRGWFADRLTFETWLKRV